MTKGREFDLDLRQQIKLYMSPPLLATNVKEGIFQGGYTRYSWKPNSTTRSALVILLVLSEHGNVASCIEAIKPQTPSNETGPPPISDCPPRSSRYFTVNVQRVRPVHSRQVVPDSARKSAQRFSRRGNITSLVLRTYCVQNQPSWAARSPQ